MKETAHKVSDIYKSASIPTINFNKIIQKIERLQKLKREKVVVNNRDKRTGKMRDQGTFLQKKREQ